MYERIKKQSSPFETQTNSSGDSLNKVSVKHRLNENQLRL